MKINAVFSMLAVMIAALLSYLIYYIVDDTDYDWVFGVCALICFSMSLISAIGVRYATKALSVNGRALAFMMFFVFLLSQFIPAYMNMNVLYYVVINLVLLFTFIAILKSMIQTKQK